MLKACFPEIECHVFQNDLTFNVVEELYRYLMDSYRELVQELETRARTLLPIFAR